MTGADVRRLERIQRTGEKAMLESTATTTKLLRKAIRHPLRAVRRLADTARLASLSEADERELTFKFLTRAFAIDARLLLAAHARSEMSAWMQQRRAELGEFPGPYRLGSTPVFDCETLYLLVRSLLPEVVVETGVCYGESSAYILQALNENRRGVLYSIDLGNSADEPPSDFFVPKHLKERWHLIIGDCKQELPTLLASLEQIDLFHHDSLHTYEHMMWEYDTALPHLSHGGVLSSHDVRTIVSMVRPFQSSPFSVFCARHRLRSVVAGNVGIALRAPTR
jgi:predicted O-methyltransferase YrrM